MPYKRLPSEEHDSYSALATLRSSDDRPAVAGLASPRIPYSAPSMSVTAETQATPDVVPVTSYFSGLTPKTIILVEATLLHHFGRYHQKHDQLNCVTSFDEG